MSIHAYTLTAIGILEILLGIYFLLKYQKSPVTNWYVVVTLSIAAFVLCNAVTFSTRAASEFFHTSQWFAAVVLTAAFFMFIIHFPFRLYRPTPHESLLFWIPVIIMLFVIYFGDFITSLDFSYLPAKQNYGGTFWAFLAFFLTYWAIVIYNMVKKIRRSDGIHRWQLRTLLFGGVLPPLILATVTGVIFSPLSITGYFWLGPEATIIWLGFTTYIMVK